jgi:hypothetical protein
MSSNIFRGRKAKRAKPPGPVSRSMLEGLIADRLRADVDRDRACARPAGAVVVAADAMPRLAVGRRRS